ncbi:MAG TPA: hypothetical protein VHC49_14840 [Mycobacteriales bacterium]|nr:hypothetical protein [Mycobacteriales bacterium]
MATDLTRRRFLAGTGAAGILATVGAHGLTPAAAATPRTPAPRSADLRETDARQRRWLSIGRSRLVLNPLDFNSTLTPLQYTASPEMPLHLGYYCSDTAVNLRSVISTYRRIAPGSGQVVTSFSDDFDTLSPDWIGDSWVERTIVDGTLQLTVTEGGTAWAVTYQWVTIDLDATPYVEITVPSATGNWGLKVNDGTQSVDIALQGDTTQVGTFTYDIAAATGWSGTKKFQLRIFAIGVGQPVQVDQIRILGSQAVIAGAATSQNAWTPHQLEFTGDYPDHSSCAATDFCYDTDTVARIMHPDRSSGWVLVGHNSGTAAWNSGVLTVTAQQYSYAVATTARVRDVAFFSSLADLRAWLNPSSEPIANGYWALEVDAGSRAVIGIGLATAKEGAAVAVRRSRAPLPGTRADEALVRRENEWDQLLARVPRPHDFSLTSVPLNGVTADQVRHTYYAAWVFAVANSLPPMPEAGYDYPQLPAGKPSLWVFGAEGAKASAAWESFLGQQFMAYVDPELAWDAFEGLMSLVGADGSLNGESLPSRKAQTAAVLYHLTGDTARLRKVYPALKRLLEWESEHLYWIPPGSTGDPDSRDADFVTELLIDMAYARDAATVLGLTDDATAWDRQRASLYQESLPWFWPTPTTQPSEYYEVTTGERDPGAAIWMSTALHLDLLPEGDYLTSLEQRFLAGYDPNGTFCSFVYAKYPDLSYTVYGLLERGMREEAEVMVNAAARDVTRARMFAENYLEHDFPTPFGVRPSLFGDCTIIDMIWIKNGYRMDGGYPQFVRLTDSAGGIDGLRIQGRRLDVALDPRRGDVVVSGSLAQARIPAPLGTTVRLPSQ